MAASVPVEQLVVDFLNTVDVEAGTDVLAADADWQQWATEHAVRAGELGVARLCREALRDLASCGAPGAPLPEIALVAAMTADGGVELIPAGPPDDACGRVLAGVATLSLQDRLDRIKICPSDDCRWAFYDRSRNSSRQWCSMAVCGNRAKTKAFRARAQDSGD